MARGSIGVPRKSPHVLHGAGLGLGASHLKQCRCGIGGADDDLHYLGHWYSGTHSSYPLSVAYARENWLVRSASMWNRTSYRSSESLDMLVYRPKLRRMCLIENRQRNGHNKEASNSSMSALLSPLHTPKAYVFSNFSMRHRPELDLCLKGVSLRLQGANVSVFAVVPVLANRHLHWHSSVSSKPRAERSP